MPGDLQDPPILADAGALSNNRNSRRRFTLGFKRRSHNRSVSGPALAIVDADPAPINDAKDKDDSKDGVRVVIRLVALDEQGTELASPNEQVTYLHVVRFGEEAEEEAKPWVVKVVKREATVSCHLNTNNRYESNMMTTDRASYIPFARDFRAIIIHLSYTTNTITYPPLFVGIRITHLSAVTCSNCAPSYN